MGETSEKEHDLKWPEACCLMVLWLSIAASVWALASCVMEVGYKY